VAGRMACKRFTALSRASAALCAASCTSVAVDEMEMGRSPPDPGRCQCLCSWGAAPAVMEATDTSAGRACSGNASPDVYSWNAVRIASETQPGAELQSSCWASCARSGMAGVARTLFLFSRLRASRRCAAVLSECTAALAPSAADPPAVLGLRLCIAACNLAPRCSGVCRFRFRLRSDSFRSGSALRLDSGALAGPPLAKASLLPAGLREGRSIARIVSAA
jgi:hypothetical protein